MVLAVDKFDREKIVASVDVPTGYPPEMNAHYDEIIRYVETSPDQISVCGAYTDQKETHAEIGQYICRAGYHFRFWFYDLEAAARFAEHVGGRLETPPVLPRVHK